MGSKAASDADPERASTVAEPGGPAPNTLSDIARGDEAAGIIAGPVAGGAGAGDNGAPGKAPLCEGFALYAFEALQPNHLSFSAGDCVRVLDMQGPENDWWLGECNGRVRRG